VPSKGPGGSIGNATLSWLSTLKTMTEVTSHELAEGVTDPDVNYKSLGWYDNANGEVGDIVNGETVFLNSYAVQRISDQSDQAMTPAGATDATPVSFVLKTNGKLSEFSKSHWTVVASNVASVSDQGIDKQGRAMVDFVTKGGAAYEFHDGSGLTYLRGGVKSAVAGQGVSYVLLTNGTLDEYQDGNGWSTIDNGIVAISAARLGRSQFGRCDLQRRRFV